MIIPAFLLFKVSIHSPKLCNPVDSMIVNDEN